MASATLQAQHPAQRHLQPDASVQKISLAHPSGASLMDQHALQAAAPAQRLAARIDRQPNQQTAVSLIRAVVNKETFPESGPRNSIHRDGIDRVEWVGLATSNLPFQLPSTVSAPGFREEPFFR